MSDKVEPYAPSAPPSESITSPLLLSCPVDALTPDELESCQRTEDNYQKAKEIDRTSKANLKTASDAKDKMITFVNVKSEMAREKRGDKPGFLGLSPLMWGVIVGVVILLIIILIVVVKRYNTAGFQSGMFQLLYNTKDRFAASFRRSSPPFNPTPTVI